MHRVDETERAENWELEKELEQLDLFFHQPKAIPALPEQLQEMICTHSLSC